MIWSKAEVNGRRIRKTFQASRGSLWYRRERVLKKSNEKYDIVKGVESRKKKNTGRGEKGRRNRRAYLRSDLEDERWAKKDHNSDRNTGEPEGFPKKRHELPLVECLGRGGGGGGGGGVWGGGGGVVGVLGCWGDFG